MIALQLKSLVRAASQCSLRSIQTSCAVQKSVAVIFSGSGVYDGTEVHEASAVLVHLSRAEAEVQIFAPDKPQMHAINHLTGETMETNRNVLAESARIARGKISPITKLDVNNFDAVIIPGGFGAAKNLSNFAVEGAAMTVDKDVESVLKGFHDAKKPIGLCCIAPVLAAKLFPKCEVTVGSATEGDQRWPYAGTAQAITQMGATHIVKDVDESYTDEANKIVTTPAYMCDTAVHQIFDGIGEMVTQVLKLTK